MMFKTQDGLFKSPQDIPTMEASRFICLCPANIQNKQYEMPYTFT